MRYQGLVALALNLIPTYLAAAPMLVQTGEHEGFTRVVITAEPGASWSADKKGSQISVKISGSTDGFLTENAFDRIGRTRINAIESTADTLIISSQCECDISTFLEAKRHIVIDIVSSQIETKTKSLRSQISTPSANIEQIGTVSYDWKLLPSRFASEASTDGFQSLLAKSLGQHGTSGLLSLNLDWHSPDFDLDMRRGKGTYLNVPERIDRAKNTNISSAMSPTTLSIQENLSKSSTNCRIIPGMNINDWRGEEEGPSKSVNSLDIFDSAGNLDASAAVDLSKELLYFGFGAEARQVLEMSLEKSDLIVALLAISDLLEKQKTDQFREISDSSHCNPELIIWSVLGNQNGLGTTEEYLGVTLRTFSEFPPHLRTLVGPKLARKLSTMDQSQAASIVLDAIERLPSEIPLEAKIELLDSSIRVGDTENADAVLSELSNKNDDLSPESFISIFSAKVGRKSRLTESDFELVNSFIYQATDDAHLDILIGLKAQGLINSLDFSNAATAIGELYDLGVSDPTPVTRSFYYEITQQADDLTFLEYITNLRSGTIEKLNGEIVDEISKRLLGIGLPEISAWFAETAQVGSTPLLTETTSKHQNAVGNEKPKLSVVPSGAEANDPVPSLAKRDFIQNDEGEILADSYTTLEESSALRDKISQMLKVSQIN